MHLLLNYLFVLIILCLFYYLIYLFFFELFFTFFVILVMVVIVAQKYASYAMRMVHLNLCQWPSFLLDISFLCKELFLSFVIQVFSNKPPPTPPTPPTFLMSFTLDLTLYILLNGLNSSSSLILLSDALLFKLFILLLMYFPAFVSVTLSTPSLSHHRAFSYVILRLCLSLFA